IFHGHGANGKSLLCETMIEVLGDYAGKAAPDLLLVKNGSAHPCEKVQLFGRRLMFIVETDSDRQFAEATMKELVGGDSVTARGMRENFWTFKPSHSLILAT